MPTAKENSDAELTTSMPLCILLAKAALTMETKHLENIVLISHEKMGNNTINLGAIQGNSQK